MLTRATLWWAYDRETQMPNWKHKVELFDLADDDRVPRWEHGPLRGETKTEFQAWRKELVDRFLASTVWTARRERGPDGYTLEELVDDLANADDVDEINTTLQYMWNWGDHGHRAWINTTFPPRTEDAGG